MGYYALVLPALVGDPARWQHELRLLRMIDARLRGSWAARRARLACVVVEPGGTVDTTDVIDHCRERLAPEKLPSEIHFLDELPRGASGKVIIDTVTEMVAKKAHAAPSTQDVYAIASECFRIPVNALSPDSTPYNTEGWDSLAHIAFIVRLEESFGIELTPAEIIDLGSLADAESIVARAEESEL